MNERRMGAIAKSSMVVVFLLFFSYAPVFLSIIQSSVSTHSVYVDSMVSLVSLLVNFGIIAMIVTEGHEGVEDPIKIILPFVGSFGAIIFIYLHSVNNKETNVSGLYAWVDSWGASLVLFILYAVCATRLKYLTYTRELSVPVEVETV